MRAQYEVNTLGPLRVTKAFLPALRQGSKVAIVSSRVGSLADNGSGGNYGYRMSKTAVNMAGVNLAHDLKPAGVTVILLHPGYVRTGMTGFNGHIDPPQSAAGLISLIDDASLAETGTFWHAEGYELPW
jgi:NAD(P)-dependent dehydrogenase (short-subunit alcohol dehydrogenase family)